MQDTSADWPVAGPLTASALTIAPIGGMAVGRMRRRAAASARAAAGADHVPAHDAVESAARPDVGVSTPLASAPPINRASMAPMPWRIPPAGKDGAAPAGDARKPANYYWRGAGSFRRMCLFGMVAAQSFIAMHFMAETLPYHGRPPLEFAILVLFTILFAWISGGFWTAIAGFVLTIAGPDRYAISRSGKRTGPMDPAARTAVVMPICNEDVARVFAGLRATYESVRRSDAADHFDFYVLSDTSNADLRVAEMDAWATACRDLGATGRLFYRWRQHRIKRKSGNIADFCRRWGRNYRYLVILDADSVMSGDCLATLMRLMEANPTAGIIQSAPHATGRDTVYARIQQFAARVYGPLFTAGLHFWQLGESHYWGHNAIIRVAPFMQHCGLRRLRGRGLLSGEILSHDFVEAALMRRAGWAVWIAYDVPGSYEEMPPTLLDELQRDRRWCQGNLMNFRLSLLNGLHAAHRAVFVSGVMAYASGLLWLLFLVLSTALVTMHALHAPIYFFGPYQLFPVWPEWHPQWALTLVGATAVLLYVPKLLAVLAVAFRDSGSYGGVTRLILSMLGEMLLSALLAPVRMLFHSQFVLGTLAGWGIAWRSPPRDDAETSWREATRRHGAHTLAGLAWAGVVYWVQPSFLWWLMPVLGALILSIPVSVLSSRAAAGRRLRALGLFLIPEESAPPREIRALTAAMRNARPLPGFADAVNDPAIARLVCASGHARGVAAPAVVAQRQGLLDAALARGLQGLTGVERMRVLADPTALSLLHRAVSSGNTPRPWTGGAMPARA